MMVEIRWFPILLLLVIGTLVTSGCIFSTHTEEKTEMPFTPTLLSTTVKPVVTPVPEVKPKQINSSEITIDPIPDHYLGDTVSFSGTTDLPTGENITLYIFSASIRGCTKNSPPCKPDTVNRVCCTGESFHRSVTITPGSDGINTWSFSINTSEYDFVPDVYEVGTVSGKTVEQGFFRIAERPEPAGFWITIEPIPEVQIGDMVTLSGETNLSAGEKVTIWIGQEAYHTCPKIAEGSCIDSVKACCSGILRTVAIEQGRPGINTWSLVLDSSGHDFAQGVRYEISVSTRDGLVENASWFVLTA
jgi:hypothetical protein